MALEPSKGREGWCIKEVWAKYEDIAMHFNDLLIKLRTQALAAVAAISVVAGIIGKDVTSEKRSWELLIAVFVFLGICWIAVWMVDFLYYNRLLMGAVAALVNLEKVSQTQDKILYIDISTKIERTVVGKIGREVAGEDPDVEGRRSQRQIRILCGVWAFYIMGLVALIVGIGYSYYRLSNLPPESAKERKLPPETSEQVKGKLA